MDKGYDVTTILPARAGEAAHISEVYAKRIVKYDYIINDIYSCDLDSPDPGRISEAFNRMLPEVFPESKIIMLSTDAVYASSKYPKDENFSMHPRTPYGKAMLDSERTLMETDGNAVIRAGIIVGRCSQNILTDSLAAIRSSEDLILYSNIIRSFSKNTDMSYYTEFLISHGLSGSYNVGGSNMTPYEFGRNLCSDLRKCTIRPEKYPGTGLDLSMDPGKIINLTGKRPESVLSMIDTIDYRIGI